MTDIPSAVPAVSKHAPWNKAKIVGAKPPLRPKHDASPTTRAACSHMAQRVPYLSRLESRQLLASGRRCLRKPLWVDFVEKVSSCDAEISVIQSV